MASFPPLPDLEDPYTSPPQQSQIAEFTVSTHHQHLALRPQHSIQQNVIQDPPTSDQHTLCFSQAHDSRQMSHKPIAQPLPSHYDGQWQRDSTDNGNFKHRTDHNHQMEESQSPYQASPTPQPHPARLKHRLGYSDAAHEAAMKQIAHIHSQQAALKQQKQRQSQSQFQSQVLQAPNLNSPYGPYELPQYPQQQLVPNISQPTRRLSPKQPLPPNLQDLEQPQIPQQQQQYTPQEYLQYRPYPVTITQQPNTLQQSQYSVLQPSPLRQAPLFANPQPRIPSPPLHPPFPIPTQTRCVAYPPVFCCPNIKLTPSYLHMLTDFQKMLVRRLYYFTRVTRNDTRTFPVLSQDLFRATLVVQVLEYYSDTLRRSEQLQQGLLRLYVPSTQSTGEKFSEVQGGIEDLLLLHTETGLTITANCWLHGKSYSLELLKRSFELQGVEGEEEMEMDKEGWEESVDEDVSCEGWL